MRTTLDIDSDVLLAVKDLARRQRRSAGAVISDLARASLSGDDVSSDDDFFGFGTIPSRGVVVTRDLIDALIEDAGE